MLETLMEELARLGLSVHACKKVVLTNEAQPPQCLIVTQEARKAMMLDTNGWGVFCQFAPLEGQLWTPPISYIFAKKKNP